MRADQTPHAQTPDEIIAEDRERRRTPMGGSVRLMACMHCRTTQPGFGVTQHLYCTDCGAIVLHVAKGDYSV